MTQLSSICLTLVIAVSLSLGNISNAEAKRFGGSSSFGSKSSYNKSYSRKASKSAPKSASQQQAYNKNQSARQTMSKRGGLMGLLGGLALGGLLGSLFFGGAFENFNFMDILLFGGIALLLFKLFATKAGRPNPAPAYNRNSHNKKDTSITSNYQRTANNTSAGFNTDIFANKTTSVPIEDALVLPKNFNQADFLTGAKGAFNTLQEAWDKKDLAEIRSLSTDKVFAEIQSQLQAMDGENHTDILKVDAELLEIRDLGNELEAVVLFDTLMREEQNTSAEQVREVWTFIKQKNSLQPKWYLDGLQQLEN